ncbi:hypothetical protein M758_1G218200 [Ceratodon purpureus]|nr:hypothetical protein M758_1G218200 [Ceratodon purpureus]
MWVAGRSQRHLGEVIATWKNSAIGDTIYLPKTCCQTVWRSHGQYFSWLGGPTNPTASSQCPLSLLCQATACIHFHFDFLHVKVRLGCSTSSRISRIPRQNPNFHMRY